MVNEWLQIVGKIISRPLAKFGYDQIKPSLERRKTSANIPVIVNYLDEQLEEVLDILSRRKATISDSIKNKVAATLSNLDKIYSQPFIQEWLNDAATRDLLKKMAIAKLNKGAFLEYNETLKEKYSHYSGEVTPLAVYAIDKTCDYLTRSIMALQSGSDKISHQLLNEKIDVVSEKTDGVSDAIGKLSESLQNQQAKILDAIDGKQLLPQYLVDKELNKLLECAKLRRPFPGADSFSEITTLAQRAENGDLCSATNPVRATAYIEAAHECFGNNKTEFGKDWLKKAKHLAPDADYSLEDALQFLSDGDIDKAITAAKKFDSLEAQRFIFNILLIHKDKATALEYYNAVIKNAYNLTGSVLVNFALKLSDAGENDFALSLLNDATQDQIDHCPALLAIRALVKVAICRDQFENDSIFASPALHPKLVKFSDSPEKIELRLSALRDLNTFSEKYTELLDVPEFVAYIEDIKLWLELEHPDNAIRQKNIDNFNESILDVPFAVRHARFVFDYGSTPDVEQMSEYIHLQKNMGELSFYEVIALFLIALKSNNPSDTLADFEANEESIIETLTEEMYIAFKVEALLKAGRRADSEAYLNEKIDIIGAEQADALKAVLFQENSNDPVEQYRTAFEHTKADAERRLLVQALVENHIFEEAAEHLEYFFQKNSTYAEAEQILSFLIKAHAHIKANIFLSSPNVQALINNSPTLLGLSAWVAYLNGEVNNAVTLLNPLPKDRDENYNNHYLALILAQETGNWEELSDEIMYAHRNRETLTAKELVRSANLGWLINCPPQCVSDLIKSAAVKANAADDPDVLLKIYMLIIRLREPSLESIGYESFKRALALSGSNGPLKQFPVHEMMPILIQGQQQNINITTKIALGEMPLGIAASSQGEALCNVIIGKMLSNQNQNDWRQKNYIPLFAGNKKYEMAHKIKRVAIDRSSLMTLDYLGVLAEALDIFDQVFIANSCLTEFLEDIEKVRFHQSSQVIDAKRLQALIAEQKIKVTPSESVTIDFAIPDGLSRDLIQFISLAKHNRGFVVLDSDEYKVTSFMEEKVDLSQVEAYLIDSKIIAEFLFNQRAITSKSLEEIKLHHKYNAPGVQADKHVSCSTPLYLSCYSLDYLIRHNLLENILSLNSNVYISQTTQQRELGLLNYIERQNRVEYNINHIRQIVKDNIATGKIKFITQISDQHKSSLLTLLSDSTKYDALIIDDRCLNKLANPPMLSCFSSLDVLELLHKENILDDDSLARSIQKLRKAGGVFIPFSAQEVIQAARRSHESGAESAELIALIEYISFIGEIGIIKIPEESFFIYSIISSCAQAIKDIWRSEDNATEAGKISKYILSIFDRVFLCIPTDNIAIYDQIRAGINFARMASVLDVIDNANLKMVKEYFSFIDEHVISDSGQPQEELFTGLGDVFKNTIEEFAKNIHKDCSGKYSVGDLMKYALNRLHPKVRDIILHDERFAPQYNWIRYQIIIFDIAFDYEIFMNYMRKIVDRETVSFIDANGQYVDIKHSLTKDGAIHLQRNNDICEIVAGQILASSKKIRKKALYETTKKYTMCDSVKSEFRTKISRRLTDYEYMDIEAAIHASPEHILDEILSEISKTSGINFDHLVPKTKNTFVALFGIPDTDNIDDHFKEVARQQYQLLDSKVDKAINKFGPAALIPQAALLSPCVSGKNKFSVALLRDSLNRYQDPFSIMFIFDLCAALAHKNDEYVKLGQEIIERIIATHSSNEFIDFEISIHLVLPILMQRNILSDMPLFYQRLCAWGWAGHIARILNGYSFDKLSMLEFTKELYKSNYMLEASIDRHAAPFWQPHLMSSNFLYGFFHRRILSSISTFCADKIPTAWQIALSATDREHDFVLARMHSLLPTPFTGLTEYDPIHQEDQESSDFIATQYQNLDPIGFLKAVIFYARSVRLSPATIGKIKDSVFKVAKKKIRIDCDDDFLPLTEGLIEAAIINKDNELAIIILDWLLSRIIEEGKDEEYITAYAILSLAWTHEDKDAAYIFMKDKLEKLACYSKDKNQIESCLFALKRIETSFPTFKPYFSKAKALFALGKYAL